MSCYLQFMYTILCSYVEYLHGDRATRLFIRLAFLEVKHNESRIEIPN